jgi:long-chain acyl-CoA synthetase
MPERSVYELFRQVRSEHADTIAYRFKQAGQWHDVTWAEQFEACRLVARALMALGVRAGDRVAVLSDTKLDWVRADFGIHSCGAVTVGIYPSNLAEDCAYILNHCEAEVLFVENQAQLDKILSVRPNLPKLRLLIRFEGPGDPSAGVLSWDEFVARAGETSEDDFEERAAGIRPEDPASFVYTSGTTGVPKGVIITHRNLLFTAGSAAACLDLIQYQVTLLFLPLAHVFARLTVYFCLRSVVTVAFAESIQTVGDNLKEVRPHFIASVPRIYEKVYDRITSNAREAGGIKSKLFDWAIGVGLRVSRLQQAREPIPRGLALRRAVADRLVFRKIQAAMGGRMTWAVSGAAPLNKQIAEFFHACGLLLLEGIGMTENTSFSNVNRHAHYKFGTVGPVGPGIEMRVAEDGEILYRGDNVMKGYFKDPRATAETIDEDGWLYTGDVGEIDEDGFLRVTDRKKDLIITAGGKNIAPQRIEQALGTSRFITQSMAYGDKRKYITALVALNAEAVESWAAEQGVSIERGEALAVEPRVLELVNAEVQRINKGLASFETVKKVRILPRELTIEDGELTPSMKIKRRVVAEKYAALLDDMYET